MSFARRTGRFGRHVFLVVAATLLAVSAAFTGYFVNLQRQRLETALVDRSRGLGGLLATGARIAVYSENAELVQETLSGVVDRRDMLSAAVFTLDGGLVAAGGRTPALKQAAGSLDDADLAVVRRLGPESGCLNHQDASVLDAYCPVLLRERGTAGVDLFFGGRADARRPTVIGFARVSLDRAPLGREIRQLALRSLAMMAVILLLGGWAGYRFARRVTEPLERLTEAVRAYGATGEIGDLSRMPDNEIGGLAEAFVGMTRGIAEREREKELLAARLRHAQKMEAVGALSQGIAHDFKNILSTLKIAVHLLEKGSPENESVVKYTGRMQVTLERARELVERLLTFSRSRELHLGVVDLAALLGKLAPAFRATLGEQVRLHLEPPGGPVPVRGDAASLEQLLANLVYNARDAMPAGGVLSIRVGVRAGASGEPPAARISVGDTGVGMAPEVRSRIFEPFFTTKGPGAGMGLGLSIVRGIVEEHRGRIEVESGPGRGTTFHVDLPLAEGPPAADGQGAEGGAGAAEGGGG
jgi:signal transduction histidine kinase